MQSNGQEREKYLLESTVRLRRSSPETRWREGEAEAEEERKSFRNAEPSRRPA